MAEEVIELSIAETNELRRKLGLKPLKIDRSREGEVASAGKRNGEGGGAIGKGSSSNAIGTSATSSGSIDDETHEDNEATKLGRSQRTAHHKPAENTREVLQAKRRIEEVKVKREVQQGLQDLRRQAEYNEQREVEDLASSTLDWASRMRSVSSKTKNDGNKKKDKKKKSSKKAKKETEQKSTNGLGKNEVASVDLEQMKVGHSFKIGEDGDSEHASSEMILTLRDESILKMDEHGHKIKGVRGDEEAGDDDDNVLENVSAAEAQRAKDNLRKKRQLELGRGHAGGYAGWDDNEFDELGGIGDAGGMRVEAGARGGYGQAPSLDGEKKKLYTLGDLMERHKDTQNIGGSTDNKLFASKQSAFSSVADDMDTGVSNLVASDVMTSEELAAEAASNTFTGGGNSGDQSAREAKRKRKQEKKEKKMFKKLKKMEKKRQRKAQVEESDDEKEDGAQSTMTVGKDGSGGDLKLLAGDDIKEAGSHIDSKHPLHGKNSIAAKDEIEREQRVATIRRQKFDAVMEKGNARTRAAFRTEEQPSKSEDSEFNNDDDGALLNTALAKARRIQRLKELQKRSKEGMTGRHTGPIGSAVRTGGDDAVAQSVISSLKENETTNKNNVGNSNTIDTVKFEFDETREFSRALLTRSEFTKRSDSRRVKAGTFSRGGVEFNTSSGVVKNETDVEGDHSKNSIEDIEKDVDMDENEQSLNELSKDIQIGDASDEEEEVEATFGSTAQAAPLGRGLAGALSMLKSTGDITGKYAGKEEMKGRAKDERTYEDYEHLDLKKVVKIDLASATEKDREFANREINLDYRDAEGRLLTRKEAWRQLCYQFHGHGSSYKNEERRTKQMQRENELRAKQAEAAERGMFGALKATQKATGKAFVVHKTS